MNSRQPLRRKTRRRYEIPGHVRFLTFSCFGRFPFFQNNAIKEAFVAQLRRSRELTRFRLFAWVVMPEHVHLLIQPRLPEFPVETVLKNLKGQFSGRVLRRWRQLKAPILSRATDHRGKQHFWLGGGGYDRNIFTEAEFEEKLGYIHHNPVRRGLVERSFDWRWSSARWYEGIREPNDLSIDPLFE